eukprot:3868781-Prymnesium_polylepis.1
MCNVAPQSMRSKQNVSAIPCEGIRETGKRHASPGNRYSRTNRPHHLRVCQPPHNAGLVHARNRCSPAKTRANSKQTLR